MSNDSKGEEHIFREKMDNALSELFPRFKSKERSSAICLLATAVLHHQRLVERTKIHLGYLLGDTSTSDHEYQRAREFYNQLNGK